MTTVYLALGSNVGQPAEQIDQAIKLLAIQLHNLKQAPIYQSKAVGYTDQPNFLNTAVSGDTDLTPQELLAQLQAIEQQVGRQKTFHNGPREIDIDIIFYGDQSLETPQLTIPHPSFRQRDFVLQPLVDIKPDLLDPSTHKTVTHLLDSLEPSQRAIIQ